MIRGQSPFLGVLWLIGIAIFFTTVAVHQESPCFTQCKDTIPDAPGYAVLIGLFLAILAGGMGIVALQEIESERG